MEWPTASVRLTLIQRCSQAKKKQANLEIDGLHYSAYTISLAGDVAQLVECLPKVRWSPGFNQKLKVIIGHTPSLRPAQHT